MPRQTKIIATLGPSTDSYEAVRDLVRAGLDVARLNFSHGDHETHRRYADRVRRAAAEEGRAVAILQDVQGPKIRVGTLPEEPLTLTAGDEVRLEPARTGSPGGAIPIDYPHLLDDVRTGHSVVLSDGLIRLEVTAVTADHLQARVRVGGELRSRKGAALPDSDLRVPTITDKDRRDLALGRELGVDLVAASFVRTAADVLGVKELAGVPVIAKIELLAAYQRLDDILGAADGVMVARGDLGVEIPLERLPTVQRDILERTNRWGRISITATEMLESMTHSPRPTRAEVTDVAVSVNQGTDAVMLSAETAVGRHPVRTVRVMDSICREAESSGDRGGRPEVGFLEKAVPFPSATARAAVQATRSLGLGTIAAFTATGGTARLLSKYRPEARIVAFTAEAKVHRRLALLWGVLPILIEPLETTDEIIARAERELLDRGLCEHGEGVVMVAGAPPNRRAPTNLMKLHRLGEE